MIVSWKGSQLRGPSPRIALIEYEYLPRCNAGHRRQAFAALLPEQSRGLNVLATQRD